MGFSRVAFSALAHTKNECPTPESTPTLAPSHGETNGLAALLAVELLEVVAGLDLLERCQVDDLLWLHGVGARVRLS